MISKESVKYSLKNLWKRKGRSSLTIISILIGIAAIFIFLSFGLGLFSYVNSFLSESSADKVTIQPRGSGFSGFLDENMALTEEDLRIIKKTNGVFEASGLVYKTAEIQQGRVKKYTFLVAHDPDMNTVQEIGNIGIFKGRELNKNEQGGIVLGYNFMIDNKIFPRGLDINDRIMVNGKNLRVVGFYEPAGNPADDAQIYVNLDYINQLYPDSKNDFGMIVARVDVNNINQVVDEIEKNLRRSRGVKEGQEDFYVASFVDLFETYTSSLNIIISFVILIALISVIVSAINTANTMITSVLERTKEVGVIKSIGARNSEIFKIFLFESSFLGFVAGSLGVLIGLGVSFTAGNILSSLGWGFLQPVFPWYLFVGCILFAVLTGGISGVIPARNASKINPVDALRWE